MILKRRKYYVKLNIIPAEYKRRLIDGRKVNDFVRFYEIGIIIKMIVSLFKVDVIKGEIIKLSLGDLEFKKR